MELRELETFRTVVEAGGIGHAAARLNRAQSSITARIRHLETSLDTSLFERQGRQLRLTAAGEKLLDYTGPLLNLAEQARTAVHSSAVCGRLRLGTMESVAATRLPHPLAEFHRLHNEVTVELQTGPSRDLVAQVQSGDLDAAIVGDEVDPARFVQIPLYMEELVLVGAADCPSVRDFSQLAGATLLVFSGKGCAYRRRFEEWLEGRRTAPARVLEFASYHAILAAAAAGVGISLVPRSVLELYPQRDALAVDAIPEGMGRIHNVFITLRGRHSPALAQLRDDLCAALVNSAPAVATSA